jgi:hypothetical protein
VSELSDFKIAILTTPDGEVQMHLLVRNIPDETKAKLLADALAAWLTNEGKSGWSGRVH